MDRRQDRQGRRLGILMNIVIGIVGALIGGFLLSFFLDTAEGGWWFTFFTAILGSVILLWIVGMVQKEDIASRWGDEHPDDDGVAGSPAGSDEHPAAGARHRRSAAARRR